MRLGARAKASRRPCPLPQRTLTCPPFGGGYSESLLWYLSTLRRLAVARTGRRDSRFFRWRHGLPTAGPVVIEDFHSAAGIVIVLKADQAAPL